MIVAKQLDYKSLKIGQRGTMLKLKIVKLFGGRLTTDEQGVSIRSSIINALANTEEDIVVDFTGVNMILPIVVNNAIAKLFTKYSNKTDAIKRVSVIGLDQLSREKLAVCLSNFGISDFKKF